MLMDRDYKLLEFMERFKMATSKECARVAYNGNIDIANRRLKKLTEDRLLYRVYNPIGIGYMYSIAQIKSTKQLRHRILRNELYFKLLDRGCKFTSIEVEPDYESIQPDALFVFKYNDISYAYFIEIECSHNKINVEKYNNFFLFQYSQFFKVKIPVLYITDKPVNRAKYSYKIVDLKFNNIDSIF